MSPRRHNAGSDNVYRRASHAGMTGRDLGHLDERGIAPPVFPQPQLLLGDIDDIRKVVWDVIARQPNGYESDSIEAKNGIRQALLDAVITEMYEVNMRRKLGLNFDAFDFHCFASGNSVLDTKLGADLIFALVPKKRAEGKNSTLLYQFVDYKNYDYLKEDPEYDWKNDPVIKFWLSWAYDEEYYEMSALDRTDMRKAGLHMFAERIADKLARKVVTQPRREKVRYLQPDSRLLRQTG